MSFEDFEDPEQRRCLYRFWINIPGGRELAENFADRYNTGPRGGVAVGECPLRVLGRSRILAEPRGLYVGAERGGMIHRPRTLDVARCARRRRVGKRILLGTSDPHCRRSDAPDLISLPSVMCSDPTRNEAKDIRHALSQLHH